MDGQAFRFLSNPISHSDLPQRFAPAAEDGDETLDTVQRQKVFHWKWRTCTCRQSAQQAPQLSDSHRQSRRIFGQSGSIRAHVWQAQREEWVDEIGVGKATWVFQSACTSLKGRFSRQTYREYLICFALRWWTEGGYSWAAQFQSGSGFWRSETMCGLLQTHCWDKKTTEQLPKCKLL